MLPSADVNPASLPCRAGAGRFGVDDAHVPAGHAPTLRLSTSPVESKNAPPVASPPIAYSDPPEYASAKSARAGVNAGPVDHVPVLMSSLRVVPLFASGAAAFLFAAPFTNDAGTPLLDAPFGVPENPPTMYRYWPTLWYPGSRNTFGAAVPALQVLVPML